MRISDWSSDVCSSDLRPVLVIEPRKGVDISDAALLDALRGRVAKWWLPDAIVRVAAMPLAITGKIDKARLRAGLADPAPARATAGGRGDRKSTRLNSSH